MKKLKNTIVILSIVILILGTLFFSIVKFDSRIYYVTDSQQINSASTTEKYELSFRDEDGNIFIVYGDKDIKGDWIESKEYKLRFAGKEGINIYNYSLMK